jgi:drug/metabolite transporter (DMT)-like permease
MLGAFLFATKGIFVKMAYVHPIDATTLICLRLLLSAPFFILVGLFCLWRNKSYGLFLPPPIKLRPDLYLKAIFVGILGYWFASYTDFVSLKSLTPQFERMILFTYPLFVILLGAAFFRQTFSLQSLWAFGLSYGGLILVFVTDVSLYGQSIIGGALWALSSAIAFALYLLWAKPLIGQLGATFFTSFAMCGATLASLIHFFLTHKLLDLWVNLELFQLIVFLAIVATVLPNYCINYALQTITSQANAVIGFINPIITLGLSAALLSIPVTSADILGTFLVLSGVALYTWLDQTSKASRAKG